MALPAKPSDIPSPLTIIRSETALSRYPVHRLARSGTISIEIRQQDQHGAATLLWEVSHNSRYGQPGPLAYKLDTLVVNRRIEEAGRPVPKILRLGSLREVCRELGLNEGQATRDVRKALFQNASTFINAQISYRDVSGELRRLEAAFTRYSVILNGEILPDGRRADAVYLILNDVYAEVLNAAVVRPLDYDYLKALSPAAQRFYEIVSYQIYAALRYNHPRAKLLYSDFCTYSTLIRQPGYEQFKKQMYSVHRSHVKSGYLSGVSYESTVDAEGRPDWIMWYVPGPKARAEYEAFSQRRKFPKSQGLLFPEEILATDDVELLALVPPEDRRELMGERASETVKDIDSEWRALAEDLTENGVNRADAERFAKECPDDCRRQLAYLPFVTEFKRSRGAYLRTAIEQGYGPPKGYEEAQAAEESKRRKVAKVSRESARQAHEEAHRDGYLAYVRKEARTREKRQDEAFAGFCGQDSERRQNLVRLAKGKLGKKILDEFDSESARLLRLAEHFHDHPQQPILSFWEWDAKVNADSFPE